MNRGQTFINGKVFTARGEDELVTALRVEGGRFNWAGETRETAVRLQGLRRAHEAGPCRKGQRAAGANAPDAERRDVADTETHSSRPSMMPGAPHHCVVNDPGNDSKNNSSM
jgi:hypothetical protein